LANGVYLYLVTVRGFDGKVIGSEVRKLVIMRYNLAPFPTREEGTLPAPTGFSASTGRLTFRHELDTFPQIC